MPVIPVSNEVTVRRKFVKVAIVTLVGDFNYGNRLQNYALQEVLTALGADTSTIDNPSQSYIRWTKEHLVERVKGKKRLKSIADMRREKNLRDFTKQYIHMVGADVTSNNFDYFIVGSDQVWNPSFWGLDTEGYLAKRYLLRNVEPSKRVAYAASFGVEELNDFWNPVFKKELSEFRAISVREVSGATIVKKSSGKTAEIVLDPTLVLPKERWYKMAADVQEGDYVLSFFLGEITQQKQEYIKRISSDKRYRIINMNDKNSRYYYCSPEVLLGLIKMAKLVVTDSFHTTVFSIVFHTPFLSLTREQRNYCKMSSRLETLLSTVEMTDRFNNMNLDDPFVCAFENVDSLIEKKRETSLLFLKDALEV